MIAGSNMTDQSPKTLETQQQHLNQLVELIAEQEAKLNRLKALRKLVKDQAKVNLELSKELKSVNDSIHEKDGELKIALNRVDSLNRQLSNYRRTRTYRNSKNVTAGKQQAQIVKDISAEKAFSEIRLNDNEKVSTGFDRTEYQVSSVNGLSTITSTNNSINNSTNNNVNNSITDYNITTTNNISKANTESATKKEPSSKETPSLNKPPTPPQISNSEVSSATPNHDERTSSPDSVQSNSDPGSPLDKRDLSQPGDSDSVDQDDHKPNAEKSEDSDATNSTAIAAAASPVPSFTSRLSGNLLRQTQAHQSPSANKFANVRQKLIDSGPKDKNTLARRVSFDPLALLLHAALEGELEEVIQRSKQVPDLSACHEGSVTALHNCVIAGHYEIAKYLIEEGCDVNVQEGDGWTPLHCAASCNNLELSRLLIESGALIYATTINENILPIDKLDETEQGYAECYEYLMYIQNSLGVINGGVVYALYDYEAHEDDELSFITNEELIVLRRDDSQEQEWWWAQKRMQQPGDTVVEIKEGYIPRNLVGLYPRLEAFMKRNVAGTKTLNGNQTSE